MLNFSIASVENLQSQKENMYYDRKSSRIKPDNIVRHVIGFANANGGILAIGIEDDGTFGGFNFQSSHDPTEYTDAILTNCIPVPSYQTDKLYYGPNKKDFIFLIKVDVSNNQVIKNKYEKVFLRTGDASIELTHPQITSLEYDRGQRFFEEQIQEDSSIDDIDKNIIDKYKEIMNVPNKSTFDILDSRGLIKNGKLTNAAVILFAKSPTKFLPNARVRFIRYEGTNAGLGQNINIIKEREFEGPLPVVITDLANMVKSQLREFQTLSDNGTFNIIPEYPEFAWFEGIVNAVTHRDYSIFGKTQDFQEIQELPVFLLNSDG